MSFQDAVSFECGSKFLKYYDCQQRVQRLQRSAAPPEPGGMDPCMRSRQDVQVGPTLAQCVLACCTCYWSRLPASQLCMVDIYVESVCSKPL